MTRVLIVDDEPAVRAALDRALRLDGYEITLAADGREALDSLADWPQQGRMLRVRATPGGGAVLETWAVDTAPDALADEARLLAHLDAQGGRPDGARGTALDRNVRLFHAPPR